jgi:dihydropteroate synthase
MLMKPDPYFILGILNATPDSFSDGGLYSDPSRAVDHALQMIADGADGIDIGGESTRPNANIISPLDEINRILPIIKILKEKNIFVSVDTRNSETMRVVLDHGADMINDVSALRHDLRSIEIVAGSNAKLCLMHMQGTPQTMQQNPYYKDVVAEVKQFLSEKISVCEQSGISKDRIIIDVGIGFGKTLEHNLMLLKNLRKFNDLSCEIMLGTSRKSFIETMTKPTEPQNRVGGSVASVLSAYQNGVKIFRVHDVLATKQALDVWRGIER